MAGHIKVRKTKAGKRRYQARIPSPENPRRDVVKTFDREADAKRWLTSQAASIYAGTFADPRDGKASFEKVAEAWKGTWIDLAPKTRVGYESILNHHVLPRLGKKKIASIKTADLQAFANDLSERLAPATVRRVFEVVSNVLRVAVERRYIVVNPLDAVRLPRLGSRTINVNPLDHGEIKALVREVPEHYRLPVLLDAYLGMRAGELWALRRRDINLLTGELSVKEALKEVTAAQAESVPAEQKLSDSLIIGPTKSYAERKITIPAFLVKELEAHLSRSLPGATAPRRSSSRRRAERRYGTTSSTSASSPRRRSEPSPAGRFASTTSVTPARRC